MPFGEPADLCLINSCTVTHVGDRKSRQVIRQAARSSPGAFVVVAGCYAEVEPEAVRAIEGVGAVIGNEGKSDLVDVLRQHSLEFGSLTARGAATARRPVPSPCPAHRLAGPLPDRATRALVKVQDGCDCHCSYCIVPAARGHQRSRPRKRW